MSNSTIVPERKTRKKPVYAAVRQMRWLVWHMCSGQKCCFCGDILFTALDLKTCNAVTLHHISGAKETDDYSRPAPVGDLLPAHSACHKAYHILLRMANQGKQIDHKRLARMERMCRRASARVKKQMEG